jgi:hypothetical protein
MNFFIYIEGARTALFVGTLSITFNMDTYSSVQIMPSWENELEMAGSFTVPLVTTLYKHYSTSCPFTYHMSVGRGKQRVEQKFIGIEQKQLND